MKKTEKTWAWLRCVGFVLCAAAMVFCFNRIYKVRAISDTTRDNFFFQEEDSMEVLFLGNCHAYSAFMPSVVEEASGLRGYMLGSADQLAETSYYYLCSALERQSPEYVVLEMFPFVVYDSYAATGAALDMYFVSSYTDLPFKDRIAHIEKAVAAGHDRCELLFELTYFHNRWASIRSLGTGWSSDSGWLEWEPEDEKILTENLEALVEAPQTEERLEIDEGYLGYLYKIIELAAEEGSTLIFVSVPYLEMTEEEAARYNTIGDIAAEYDIPYLNFTKTEALEELGLRRAHMADMNHVNADGAQLISEYLGEFLRDLESAGT